MAEAAENKKHPLLTFYKGQLTPQRASSCGLAGRTGGLEKGSDKRGGQQDQGCNPDFSIPSRVPLLPRGQVRVHFPKLPDHSFPSALPSSPSHQIPPSDQALTGTFMPSSSHLQSFLRKHLCSSHAHEMIHIFIFLCDAKTHPPWVGRS